MKNKLFNEYIKLGFMPLRLAKYDKHPSGKREKAQTNQYSHNSKYGMIVPPGVLVIDVDVKNGKVGQASFDKLQTDMGQEIPKTVITGSGGFHCYCKIDKPVKKNQAKYPDIDFFTVNINPNLKPPYVIAGGQSIMLKEGLPEPKNYPYTMVNENEEEDQIELIELKNPDILEYQKTEDYIKQANKLVDENVFTIAQNIDNFHENGNNLSDISELMNWVVAKNYDDWIYFCFAIYSASGGSEEGREVFLHWSRMQPGYKKATEEEALKYWNDVVKSAPNHVGPRATEKSIFYFSLESKKQIFEYELNEVKSQNDFLNFCKNSKWGLLPTFYDEVMDLFVTPLLGKKASELGVLNPHNLAKQNSCLIRINNDKRLKKQQVQKELMKSGSDKTLVRILGEIQVPQSDLNILSQHFYNPSEINAPYYNTEMRKDLTEKGIRRDLFKITSRIAKLNNFKSRVTIDKLIEWGLIRTFYSFDFQPNEDVLFKKPDTPEICLNLFDKNLLPKPSESICNEAQSDINRFVQHYNILFGEEVANTLFDFAAFAIQNLGQKVLWVPLLHSYQGSGKSLFGDILKNHIFGSTYSNEVKGQEVQSQFNGWVANKLFVKIEELTINGHNRYEAPEALKPLITNPKISLNKKNKNVVEIANHCNFIALTNNQNPISLENSDRRWYFVKSKPKNHKAFERIINIDWRKWITPVFKMAKLDYEYRADLLRWFLDRDVTNFEYDRAPMTRDKETLILQTQLGSRDTMNAHQFLQDIIFNNKEFNPIINTNKIQEAYADAVISPADTTDEEFIKNKIKADRIKTQYPGLTRNNFIYALKARDYEPINTKKYPEVFKHGEDLGFYYDPGKITEEEAIQDIATRGKAHGWGKWLVDYPTYTPLNQQAKYITPNFTDLIKKRDNVLIAMKKPHALVLNKVTYINWLGKLFGASYDTNAFTSDIELLLKNEGYILYEGADSVNLRDNFKKIIYYKKDKVKETEVYKEFIKKDENLEYIKKRPIIFG